MKVADAFIEKMENLRIFLREELKWSQAMIIEYANRRRLPVSAFKVDDIIMLDSRNIKTARLNKSLDYKNLGSFKITKVINNMIYELELLDGMNIYPVFYL